MSNNHKHSYCLLSNYLKLASVSFLSELHMTFNLNSESEACELPINRIPIFTGGFWNRKQLQYQHPKNVSIFYRDTTEHFLWIAPIIHSIGSSLANVITPLKDLKMRKSLGTWKLKTYTNHWWQIVLCLDFWRFQMKEVGRNKLSLALTF